MNKKQTSQKAQMMEYSPAKHIETERKFVAALKAQLAGAERHLEILIQQQAEPQAEEVKP